MSIKDAVIICVKVLRMDAETVAMAYAMPVAEVQEIIRLDGRRKTGRVPVAPLVTNGVNGVHAKGLP